MRVHVLVGMIALTVGSAAGYFVGTKHQPEPAPHGDAVALTENEAVVEFRVRVPPSSGKSAPARSGGALVNTANQLDLAIEGNGYLQVTLPNGELRYTRDGALRLNNVGNLVTSDGFLVNPQVTIPQSAVSISIGSDGTISVQNAGATNVSTQLGQLTLARFVNEGGLSPDGMGLFAETQSSGTPNLSTPGLNGAGFIRQGFRERRAEHFASALADLVQQIADEERRNGAVNGVTVRSR